LQPRSFGLHRSPLHLSGSNLGLQRRAILIGALSGQFRQIIDLPGQGGDLPVHTVQVFANGIVAGTIQLLRAADDLFDHLSILLEQFAQFRADRTDGAFTLDYGETGAEIRVLAFHAVAVGPSLVKTGLAGNAPEAIR